MQSNPNINTGNPTSGKKYDIFPDFQLDPELIEREVEGLFGVKKIREVTASSVAAQNPLNMSLETEVMLRNRFPSPIQVAGMTEPLDVNASFDRAIQERRHKIIKDKIGSGELDPKRVDIYLGINWETDPIRVGGRSLNVFGQVDMTFEEIAALQDLKTQYGSSSYDQSLLFNKIESSTKEELIALKRDKVFLRLHPGARAQVHDRIYTLGDGIPLPPSIQ